MTSLELFPKIGNSSDEPPEWGTGKLKEHVNLWTPKPPTWHHTGEPKQHAYALTKLRLSNVRMTDQLLPRPQDTEMGKLLIKKPFPAEHPFLSHTSQFSVFPKFDTPEDRTRGVDARKEMPKHPEMPSKAYDVIILSKTKGNGYRREIQALPSEANKKALEWHEGDTYDQVTKYPDGNQLSYYPIPPKTYVPNLEQRDSHKVLKGDMNITPQTANATRNVERNQWTTSYDLAHTGLGPSNPLALDNYDEKQQKKIINGEDDDKLYPRSVPTFDPPRPFEGRQARALVPPPPPQTDRFANPPSDPHYRRKATLSEIEEDRLWNGKEYVNLPEANRNDEQWRHLGEIAHPSSGLSTLAAAQQVAGEPTPRPYEDAGPPGETLGRPTYLDKMRAEQAENVQQIEAENRFNLLNSQTPDHNLVARKHKMDLAVDKSHPKVFYDHEGKYQMERSGLYKTDYDPYTLQERMKGLDFHGAPLFDHSSSHLGALDNPPMAINQEMNDIIRNSRTLGGVPASVPQFHGQPSPFEAFEPYAEARRRQTGTLLPQADTAAIKTQENGVTLTESTYGDSYSTQKFLQERGISEMQRNEPLNLMSQSNRNLHPVRLASVPRTGKSVQFNEDITVAAGAGGEPIRLASAPISNPKQEGPYRGFQPEGAGLHTNQTSGDPTASYVPAAHGQLRPPLESSESMGALAQFHKLPVPLEKSRFSYSLNKDPIVNREQFGSRSSNLMPANMRHSWAGHSAYEAQFAPSVHVDMSFKNDERFNWSPGCGTPRPQTYLLSIQNSFTKTQARQKFHERFPEVNVDLRENHLKGKKHEFGGLNAQILRGTPVVA